MSLYSSLPNIMGGGGGGGNNALSKMIKDSCNTYYQEGRGHWTVYYTSFQSFEYYFLICWHNIFGDFIEF